MKTMAMLFIMFLCFSTMVKAQELKSGKIYVVYEKDVKNTPEEENGFSYFFVLSTGKDITISEAIFDQERKQFFVGIDFTHNINLVFLKKYMTTRIAPVKVENGEVFMPLYK